MTDSTKIKTALEFAAAGFAVIANDRTTAEHSREFARANFEQAKSALDNAADPASKPAAVKRRSLLPNSEPRILLPVAACGGVLQVRLIGELEDHGLFYRTDAGESLLAIHNNGYSCHALLERMAAGHTEKALAQAQYILDCGGVARSFKHIAAIMTPEKESA